MSAFHAYAYGPFVVDGLPVFAPQETIDFIRAYVGGDTIAEVFDFRAVADGDTAVIGDLSLRFAETAHSVVNVATRIETGGRVLVYTGDTGPAGSWPELAQDAHLLLSEASLHDDSEPYEFHLTASQAGSIARERSVRSLMLTHIPPHLDSAVSVLEAERMFDRPVGIAVPGGVVRV